MKHIIGNITDDLYAIPMKKCDQKTTDQRKSINSEKEWNSQNELPPGWEKHEGKYLFALWW